MEHNLKQKIEELYDKLLNYCHKRRYEYKFFNLSLKDDTFIYLY